MQTHIHTTRVVGVTFHYTVNMHLHNLPSHCDDKFSITTHFRIITLRYSVSRKDCETAEGAAASWRGFVHLKVKYFYISNQWFLINKFRKDMLFDTRPFLSFRVPDDVIWGSNTQMFYVHVLTTPTKFIMNISYSLCLFSLFACMLILSNSN